MKTALIADVHGNFPALLTVLDQVRKFDCQLIISLGDIAGYYCMINECITLCREYDIVNILGNHDQYLISGTECPRSMSANICLEYQRKIITPDNFEWLKKSLPMYREDDRWFVHGGWHDYLDEYVKDFNFIDSPDPSVKIFASGHSHMQSLQGYNGIAYVNPGSVGQPRDEDPRAAFAIIDEAGQVSLHRVEYDIDTIAAAMRNAGFEDRYCAGLYSGSRIKTYRGKS